MAEPHSPVSGSTTTALLCHDIAAVAIEHADQLDDPARLANLVSLYGHYLEDASAPAIGFEAFVFDRAALAQAARMASAESGIATAPPEPLRHPSDPVP